MWKKAIASSSGDKCCLILIGLKNQLHKIIANYLFNSSDSSGTTGILCECIYLTCTINPHTWFIHSGSDSFIMRTPCLEVLPFISEDYICIISCIRDISYLCRGPNIWCAKKDGIIFKDVV